jgi:hypothetical protein
MRLFRFLVVVGLCMSLSPGAVLPRDMNPVQFGAWARAQQAVPHRDVKTFTPTAFVGFSVPPTGELLYADLGAIAMIWTNGPYLGTSNATTFELSGVPEAIRPTEDTSVMFSGYNGGLIIPAQATVLPNGDIAFENAQTTALLGGPDIHFTDAWINPGTKGLPSGAFLIYPKF